MDSRDRAALTRTLQAIYREIGAMGERVYQRVLPGGRLPARNGGTGTSQGAEPPLGNPASDGQVLASTTAGVRSWADRTASHDHTSAAGDGGVLSNDEHDGYSEYAQIVTPPGPASGKVRVWAAPDGHLYQKEHDGTVTQIDGTPPISSLDDIGDVDAPTPDVGDVLTFDGVNWVADPPAGGGVPRPFAYLLDADGNFLVDGDGAYLFEYIDTPDSGGASLTIAEIDGTPSGTPSTLQFPDGTLTDEGGGVYRYTPAAGGTPNRAYFARLAALLDPGAIEPLLSGTFTYTVGPSETKYVLGSYNVEIDGSGKRLETRHSDTPLALHDVTMVGAGSDALAVTLDPSLAVDADPEATYYARLLAIDDLPTKVISASGNLAHATLLAGPYGVIITRMVIFNLTWMGAGLPNDSELGDSGADDHMRWDSPHRSPMNKLLAEVANGYAGGVGANIGSVAYVILPGTWSTVPDPISASYADRDDFMGATLDTTTGWTRTQSTAGNVEIAPEFAWLKLVGNGSFGNNAARRQAGHARSAERSLVVDVYPGLSTGSLASVIVGWGDGGGNANANLVHAVQFGNSGGAAHLYLVDQTGGLTDLGAGTYTLGYVYRLRITARAGGGAIYEIQSAKPGEYEPLYGAAWATLTHTSNVATAATLYPMATVATTTPSYIGDVRVY